jgi:hypothetical protein
MATYADLKKTSACGFANLRKVLGLLVFQVKREQ